MAKSSGGGGRAGRILSGNVHVGDVNTFSNRTTEFRITRNYGERFDVATRPAGSKGRFRVVGSLPTSEARMFARHNRLR